MLGPIVTAVAMLSAGYAQASDYQVYELPGLENPLTEPNAVNDFGIVAGYATVSPSEGHAVLWENGVLDDLHNKFGFGTLNSGKDISANGTVAIDGFYVFGGKIMSYKDGVTEVMPLPEGCDVEIFVRAINDNSTLMVGNCGLTDSSADTGAVYSLVDGEAFSLPLMPDAPPDKGGSAYDVNNDGYVIGTNNFGGTDGSRSYYWKDGVMAVIENTLGGEAVNVYAMNNRGIIVGTAADATLDYHAYSYDIATGQMTILGGGAAKDVNDRGQAVGDIGVGCCSEHAILYENGQIIDLHEFMKPEWYRSDAEGINNLGWIVGESSDEAQNVYAWLLVPLYDKGDFDGDGDVDLQDAGNFQRCFAAEDYIDGTLHIGCSVFDFDDDVDLDLADYAAFQAAFTGPTSPDMNPYGPG